MEDFEMTVVILLKLRPDFKPGDDMHPKELIEILLRGQFKDTSVHCHRIYRDENQNPSTIIIARFTENHSIDELMYALGPWLSSMTTIEEVNPQLTTEAILKLLHARLVSKMPLVTPTPI